MRTKRSYRKKISSDKEADNSSSNNGNEKSNLPVVAANSTSSEMNNSFDNNMIKNQEFSSISEEFDKILSSYSIDNEHDNIDVLLGVNSIETNLSLSGSQGTKRPLVDLTHDFEQNKRFESSGDTISDDILNLKQKNIEFESRIKTLEEQWMQSSADLVINQSIDKTSNISRDDQENTNISKNSTSHILLMLKMNPTELAKCHKKTATATARSVIKCLYPDSDSNFRYRDVDKSVVNVIIEYTKLSNPNDNTSDTERRRAISNYFAYMAHQRKLRMAMVSDQVSSEPKKDNSNTTLSR